MTRLPVILSVLGRWQGYALALLLLVLASHAHAQGAAPAPDGDLLPGGATTTGALAGLGAMLLWQLGQIALQQLRQRQAPSQVAEASASGVQVQVGAGAAGQGATCSREVERYLGQLAETMRALQATQVLQERLLQELVLRAQIHDDHPAPREPREPPREPPSGPVPTGI